MYSLSQGQGGLVTILYQTLAAAAREARIELHGPLGQGRRATVILRPVKLVHLEGLIRSSSSHGMAAYARELAFGAL
jgi:hypothetical protein